MTISKIVGSSALLMSIIIAISSLKSMNEMDRQNQLLRIQLIAKSRMLADVQSSGGFGEMPITEVGKPLYLLIIQSFNGGAVFKENTPPDLDLLNTRFYVAYDMEKGKFIALQDSIMGLSGKDFVVVITQMPNGSRVYEPKKGAEAEAIARRFNLGYGPTRY